MARSVKPVSGGFLTASMFRRLLLACGAFPAWRSRPMGLTHTVGGAVPRFAVPPRAVPARPRVPGPTGVSTGAIAPVPRDHQGKYQPKQQ